MQWQYEYQVVHSVCVECSAACDTPHCTQRTHCVQTETHIATAYQQLLTMWSDDFKETVTLARLHHMLPDDGP